MAGFEIFGIVMMLAGSIFAYMQRTSHEDVGVYGIVVAILGLVLFCNAQRKILAQDIRRAAEEKDKKA